MVFFPRFFWQSTFLIFFHFFCCSIQAQTVVCPAPPPSSPGCYQTSRPDSGNSLVNWPPLSYQDCCNAFPICDPLTLFSSGTLVPVGAPLSVRYPGCVIDELPNDANTCFKNNEKATTWLKWQIAPLPGGPTQIGAPAGYLRFKIVPLDVLDLVDYDPVNDNGSTGLADTDYDFLLFKFPTYQLDGGENCTAIKNSPAFGITNSVIQRCNWTGVRGPVGLFEPGTGDSSASGLSVRFNRPLKVKVGDVFYMAVDNFSLSSVGFYLDFRALESANDSTAKITMVSPVISGSTQQAFCVSGTLSVANPISGATYLWSTGGTGTNLSIASPGTYTVRAISNGCTSAVSQAIVVSINQNPNPPSITGGSQQSFCSGSNLVLSVSNPIGSMVYLWSNNLTGASITVSNPGTYSVRAISNSCTSVVSQPVTVTITTNPSPPIISGQNQQSFCGSDTLFVSNPISGTSYIWSNNTLGASLIVSNSGTYSVRAISNGCTSLVSQTVTVSINPLPIAPTITNSGPLTLCSGQAQTVTLTSSASSGNQWLLNGNALPGETGISLVVGYAGIFSVRVTGANTCQSTSNGVTVVVNLPPPVPNITPAGPVAFCQGNHIILTSSASSNNQWFFNGDSLTSSTAQLLTVTQSGQYMVRVRSNGCSSFSQATSVTVYSNPSPPIISGSSSVCQGDSITLTSSYATGNQWLINGSNIPLQTNENLVVKQAGSYTVRYTNANSCSSISQPLVVILKPAPAIPQITATGSTVFCEGKSVLLTSTASFNNQWYKNTVPIPSATNSSYIATTSGAYLVRVTDPGNGCFSNSEPSQVTANPLPQFTFQPVDQTLQVGQNAQFSVVITGSDNITYQWQSDVVGTGFQNLNNVLQYQDVLTPTLTVNNITPANNNQPFRCKVKLGDCSDTSDIAILSVITSKGKMWANNPISIIPNPASEIIEVRGIYNHSTLVLYDVHGKEVGKYTNFTDRQISVSHLPQGIYNWRVQQNNQWFFGKWAKE